MEWLPDTAQEGLGTSKSLKLLGTAEMAPRSTKIPFYSTTLGAEWAEHRGEQGTCNMVISPLS